MHKTLSVLLNESFAFDLQSFQTAQPALKLKRKIEREICHSGLSNLFAIQTGDIHIAEMYFFQVFSNLLHNIQSILSLIEAQLKFPFENYCTWIQYWKVKLFDIFNIGCFIDFRKLLSKVQNTSILDYN